MKTKLLMLLPALTLLSFKSSHINFKKNDTFSEKITGLKITSFLTDDAKKVTDYSIIIYKDGTVNDTINMNSKKNAAILLEYNSNYTLKYVKDNFRERVVLIDTHVKAGIEKKNLSFDFEIEMVKENESPNTLSDLPVAIIKYYDNENKFDYSRKYHNQVRQKSST